MLSDRYEKLRHTLEARKQDLLRDLELNLRDVRSQTAYEGEPSRGLDTAEYSNAQLQQEIDISVIEMRSETLRRISDALARLADGVYGQCAECGGEISAARLNALPFAIRCRECETVHERHIRTTRRTPEARSAGFGWLDSDSQD